MIDLLSFPARAKELGKYIYIPYSIVYVPFLLLRKMIHYLDATMIDVDK